MIGPDNITSGITLDWVYKQRQVHLSMLGYGKKALKQFRHEMKHQQHSPYPCAPIKYGATKTIHNAGINSTTPRRTGETFHITTLWQVPLPGQSNRQYPAMPDQRTGGTIIQSYQRHNAMCNTITWLSGHTGRSNTNIQCKQCDLTCAQQCKLPQQTQGAQKSRWPLLLIKRHTTSGK